MDVRNDVAEPAQRAPGKPHDPVTCGKSKQTDATMQVRPGGAASRYTIYTSQEKTKRGNDKVKTNGCAGENGFI